MVNKWNKKINVSYFSHTVGMWMPGNPSTISFEPDMEEALLLFKPRQILRVVMVLQAPFLMWNETKSMIIGKT